MTEDILTLHTAQGVQFLGDESYRGGVGLHYDQHGAAVNGIALNTFTDAVNTNLVKNARSSGVMLGQYVGGSKSSTSYSASAITR